MQGTANIHKNSFHDVANPDLQVCAILGGCRPFFGPYSLKNKVLGSGREHRQVHQVHPHRLLSVLFENLELDLMSSDSVKKVVTHDAGRSAGY